MPHSSRALSRKKETVAPQDLLSPDEHEGEESPPAYDSDTSNSDADNGDEGKDKVPDDVLSTLDLLKKSKPLADADEDTLDGVRKSIAIAEAFEIVLLQPSLAIGFTIYVQHKLSPLVASSGTKILSADYVAIELSESVYEYLYAIKYNTLKKPPKPEVLNTVFAKDVKKITSCGVMSYGVQSGGKSVSLDEDAFVTWEDVLLAVYMLPLESYDTADHLWDTHDEYQYSWVEKQL